MLASGRPTFVGYSVVFGDGARDFVTSDCIRTRPPNTLHLSVILPPTPRSIPRTRYAAPAVMQETVVVPAGGEYEHPAGMLVVDAVMFCDSRAFSFSVWNNAAVSSR